MVLLKNILHGDFASARLFSAFREERALSDAIELFASAAHSLYQHGVDGNERVFPIWVPARVEVLGKHTDYAGGKSLIAALSKGFAFISHLSRVPKLHVLDAGSQQHIHVDLENPNYTTPYSWGVYVQAVLERVQQNFGQLEYGASIAMSSNVPTASGMSSSSALITGLFMSLKALYRLEEHSAYKKNIQSSIDLADYLGHIENGQTYKELSGKKGVGTFGGSQDHIAILCSEASKLRLFDFQSAGFTDEITLPEGYCFVIGCSGVRAEKARSALGLYNRCALLVKQILANKDLNPGGRYRSLGEMASEESFSYSRAHKILIDLENGEELSSRLFQFLQETYEIIPGVIDALRNGDYGKVGQLVDLSHRLANTHLRNQTLETNYLARSARILGAVASSAFGAGFGGSVWALVEEKSSVTFRQAWESSYVKEYPQWQKNASFFIDPTGDGATVA